MNETISIPAPEYEKSQAVWLFFQGSTIPTSIKVRAYDPDRERWLYRVALSGQWHKSEELGHRSISAVELEGQTHG